MAKLSEKIVIAKNLQTFFYDRLSEANKKSLLPIPESLIFYSSDVLNRFLYTDQYFENVQGRLKEKVLGIKLLDSNNHHYEERRKILKDVGDTTMILCGHFRGSIKEKVLNIGYYKDIGKTAYINLNKISPSFLDMPGFYGNLANCFDSIVTMISSVARMGTMEDDILSKYGEWLETKSDELKRELEVLGVKVQDDEKKCS